MTTSYGNMSSSDPLDATSIQKVPVNAGAAIELLADLYSEVYDAFEAFDFPAGNSSSIPVGVDLAYLMGGIAKAADVGFITRSDRLDASVMSGEFIELLRNKFRPSSPLWVFLDLEPWRDTTVAIRRLGRNGRRLRHDEED